MKIKALINYTDYSLNKKVEEGSDLVELYNEEGIELTEERIEALLKGNASSNNKPFVEVVKEVETADVAIDNMEVAVAEPKRKKARK